MLTALLVIFALLSSIVIAISVFGWDTFKYYNYEFVFETLLLLTLLGVLVIESKVAGAIGGVFTLYSIKGLWRLRNHNKKFYELEGKE